MYKERDEKTGMTVPKGFFEEMERKINAQIDAEMKQQETPVIQMGKRSLVWRVAAIVTLVLGVGLIYMGVTGNLGIESEDSQLAKVRGAAAVGTDLAETEKGDETEMFELPEQVEESMVASISDYDMYCIMCGFE